VFERCEQTGQRRLTVTANSHVTRLDEPAASTRKMEGLSSWDVCNLGGLVSDCHGRLGQGDTIEVEKEDEFDDGMHRIIWTVIMTGSLRDTSSMRWELRTIGIGSAMKHSSLVCGRVREEMGKSPLRCQPVAACRASAKRR
jgi:hypothetical protein